MFLFVGRNMPSPALYIISDESVLRLYAENKKWRNVANAVVLDEILIVCSKFHLNIGI
jgi:hypothetical protein